MNDQSPIEVGTALALPTSTEVLPLFTTENGTEPLIAQIEAAVANFVADTSTTKGREEIRGMAYKVTKSKTALIGMAKTAKEDAAKVVKSVNIEAKRIETRLDALRDKTRQPLTDWETDDVARKDREAELLAALDVKINTLWTSEEMACILSDLNEIVIDATYGDAEEPAHIAKATSIERLTASKEAAERQEKEAVELAELRAFKVKQEAAEIERQRVEQERIAEQQAKERAEVERLAAVKAEAERAEREAAQAEADRITAEKAKAAQVEREKVAAEQAAAAEKERAAKAAKEAEERHARDMQEAKEKAERDAAAERQRIADKQAAGDAERAKRAADTVHNDRIAKQITAAIRGLEVAGDLDPKAVCDALMAGEIPHVSVTL